MNTKEYFEYKKRVEEFFRYEGINCLTADHNEWEEGYEQFSARSCDCCSGLPGERYQASGFNPEEHTVQSGYTVCTDCLYFTQYGQLDDMTMMDVDLEELAELEKEEEHE